MTDLMTTKPAGADDLIEQVVIQGNLAGLTPQQRAAYYQKVCSSLGLNPYTRPFEYLTLQQGKLTLYARKDATDQLRSLRRVSLTIVAREVVNDVYVVTARATLPDGRADEEIGAVPIAGLKGEAYANALMKASTKAKRRVTLSICGLGMLDETETETIPGAQRFEEDAPVVREPVPERVDEELAERQRMALAMNPPNERALEEAPRRIMQPEDFFRDDEDAPPARAEAPGDDPDALSGQALADACDRLRRRLAAANLPYAAMPTPRTNASLRAWWRAGAALLATGT